VGDRVLYEETPEGATITAVEPRRNYLIRRASNLSKESHVIASNLDRALLVATLFSPVTNTEFIDRFLVTCEAYAIPAAIVLNKLDLAAERPDELDEFIAIYETAGYTVYPVSATEGTGLETLRELTAGKTTLLTGNSGAGKSTLIKALVPDADVRINRISEYHHKGMHTTTFARMYPLAGGGNIIDTPGIKGFGLPRLPILQLHAYARTRLCSHRCRRAGRHRSAALHQLHQTARRRWEIPPMTECAARSGIVRASPTSRSSSCPNDSKPSDRYSPCVPGG